MMTPAPPRTRLRRMGNQGVLASWNTWYFKWYRRRRLRGMIGTVASAIMRPRLAYCVAAWRRGWEKAEDDKHRVSVKEQIERACAQARR